MHEDQDGREQGDGGGEDRHPPSAEVGGELPGEKQSRPRGRIAALDSRIAELQARRERLVALERERARKRDTKRRIVLGGGLIAAARQGDSEARRIIASVVNHLDRNADRAAFDGWEIPAAAVPERNGS